MASSSAGATPSSPCAACGAPLAGVLWTVLMGGALIHYGGQHEQRCWRDYNAGKRPAHPADLF